MSKKARKNITATTEEQAGGRKKTSAKKPQAVNMDKYAAIVTPPEMRQPAQPFGEPLGAKIKSYGAVLNSAAAKATESFKNDLDPEKIQNLKNETRKILKYGAIYLAVILAAASLLILPEAYFSRKILANTFVGDVAVGSLTPEEATQKLTAAAKEYLEKPIAFIYDGQTVSMTPQELGIRFSIGKTVRTLPVVNFTQANTFEILASMIAKRNVAAGYDAENEKIIAGLQDKTGLSQRRAKDASISFRDGQFFITPEAAGEKINETKLLADLQGNLKNLESNPITIELESETPGISAAQLEAGKNKIGDKLKNQITLKYAGGKIKFKPLDHLDAVRLAEKTEIELGSGGISLPYEIAGQDAALNQDSPLKVVHKIEAEIIPQKIDSYLQENLVKDIEIPTSPVTITQNADGKITIEGKGEDGKTVHKERLIAAINRAINNGIPTVKVPVVIEKAPVNVSKNLQDLGIKQLLATGYTTYYGSAPNRRHNINLGISKYNGLLIKPGEEFSFNTILGNVDGSTGYLQEKVIKKNKIELEYGGGICQVSSTLYRAILFAGLPVTERNPHSWKVSYYSQVLGDGLDATIYPGVSDVKFINDTPASLVMQAYAEGSAAYFKFYGTSDGRAVTLQGPFGGGLNYKWYRIINKNGQETKETIISNYKPIPPPDPPAPKPVVAQTPPLKPTI